jgi:aminopeptidase N
MAHPIRPDSYQEINNFYTATVYQKGAEVIRMLLTLLGTEGFRNGMDLYFSYHDGQAVTCDDFVGCMAEANGADLDLFMGWYSQAGTPRLKAVGHYDAASRSYALTLSQHTPPTAGQPDKQALHIPVAVGLIGRMAPICRCSSKAKFVLPTPPGCSSSRKPAAPGVSPASTPSRCRPSCAVFPRR